jgi:K+-transporting ATPase ATPase C chain
MFAQLRTSTLLLLAITVLTGVIYPLVVTGVAQLLFPKQSNGSLFRENDQVLGSELIGQAFVSPRYFWSRLSATSPVPYNGNSSGGSNFGPLNPELKKSVDARIKELSGTEPLNKPVPVDLVTASGSGLDPHISPAAAEFQVSRIAKARNLSEEVVRELVVQHTEGRQFGVLGEPRVRVLRLNIALDQVPQKK